jgi:hypothetical protein
MLRRTCVYVNAGAFRAAKDMPGNSSRESAWETSVQSWTSEHHAHRAGDEARRAALGQFIL